MKKDIIRVFSVNLIKMFSTLITTFLVPSVLSVENYGQYKLYLFYVSYMGASHLGFCDGVYLKYGGMKKGEIDLKSVSSEHKTLLFFEFFISLIFFILGVIKNDFIIIILALTNVPLILVGYYNFIFQAIGDFQQYTRNQLIATVVGLLFNVVLVGFNVDDYKRYIVAHCIIQYISCIIAFVYFKKDGWLVKAKASLNALFCNIQMGFLLLIGNFVYNLFVGLDKWFIKFVLDITDFSLYSFSSQLLSVINMFVTPIGLTLYSNISRRKDAAFEKKIERVLFALLLLIPICVYIFEIVIRVFLNKYIDAISTVGILFIAQIFISINTAFFVNIYKSYREQKQYFVRILIALFIAIVTNILVLMVSPTIEHFAMATLFSSIVWFMLNCCYYKYLRPDLRLIVFMTTLVFAFFVGFNVNCIVIKIAVYMIIYIILLKFLLNDVWKYGYEQIKKLCYKYIKG